ncbi:MAG: hypothetical protein IKS36_02630 [Bacteroidales bacterium]|nr:hypothetical protein [Bacteroidales bacterium]
MEKRHIFAWPKYRKRHTDINFDNKGDYFRKMLATVCLREFAILTLYDNVLTVAS